MNKGASLESWVEAATAAADDTALGALGFEKLVKVPAEDWSSFDCNCGGYISLMTPHEAIQVGWAAELESCTALARLLLVLEDEDPDPGHSEVRDAMQELANIVAGALKTKIVKRGVTNIQLGIPFFLMGRLTVVKGVEESVTALEGGDMRCALHVTRYLFAGSQADEEAA